MSKTDIKLSELVDMIKNGELRLPEMQRRYVWRATRVRDLLDSLYRGYPSGSILVWETDKEQPNRELAVTQDISPFTGHKLLLDGQQRLTSLTSVMNGEPVKVKNRKKPIDILFNLDHPESLFEFTEVDSDMDSPLPESEEMEDEENGEDDLTLQDLLKQKTFVVAGKVFAQQKNWVSVTDVFKANSDLELLKAAGITSFEDPSYEKYSTRLKKLRSIKDYQYSMHVLPKTLSYEEVAEIFVRVNSLGVKLRGSDLALAQITARWPNSLKLLEEYQEECEEHWMTLDLGLLVRGMVVFATHQARFDKVATTHIDKFKEGWEKAKEGLNFAINFLRTNANIEDESLLSSPLFFIVLAYFIDSRNGKLTEQEEKYLLYWLYVANMKGRYSRGSTESLLDADLNVIKKGGGPKELIEVLLQQFGRLDVDIQDLVGRGAGSPLFSMVYLTLKAKGAKDWYSGLGISLNSQGKYHYIQYHHIFPKSLLKKDYDKSEINEIANMAFISGKTNRHISNKEPKVYFIDIIKNRGKEAIIAQCVPTEPELLELNNYKSFLTKRRGLLKDAVNDFLKSVIS
ncbi:MAG: DUF262 domain-containing protein [Ignavibacteriaceae bacterium]